MDFFDLVNDPDVKKGDVVTLTFGRTTLRFLVTAVNTLGSGWREVRLLVDPEDEPS